jgi:predicted MFS family arabinose efflux permease
MLGLPVGILFSNVFSGIIAKTYGWRMTFFVATVPGLVLAVVASRLVDPPRGAADAGVRRASTTSEPFWRPFGQLMRIPTLRWIVLSGAIHNFIAYAVNGFMPAYLGRYHGLDLRQANVAAGLMLGGVGILSLLLGGPLADWSRRRRPNGRLLLGSTAFLAFTPCVYLALRQPAGRVLPFVILMGIGWMLFYLYYATVYASVHDVVRPELRGSAMSLYFFWMYVLGGAFGTAILGMLSDYFARRAMALGGGAAMTEAFRAAGLHDAFFIVPILALSMVFVLFAASRTVAADMQAVARPASQ